MAAFPLVATPTDAAAPPFGLGTPLVLEGELAVLPVELEVFPAGLAALPVEAAAVLAVALLCILPCILPFELALSTGLVTAAIETVSLPRRPNLPPNLPLILPCALLLMEACAAEPLALAEALTPLPFAPEGALAPAEPPVLAIAVPDTTSANTRAIALTVSRPSNSDPFRISAMRSSLASIHLFVVAGIDKIARSVESSYANAQG